jgi:hypothetical protein
LQIRNPQPVSNKPRFGGFTELPRRQQGKPIGEESLWAVEEEMKARILFLVLAVALVMTMSLPASAQVRQQYGQMNFAQDRDDHNRDHDQQNDRDHDRDHNQYGNSRAYQDGYRDGGQDRDRHQRSHPRGNQWKGDDRNAYEAGYRAGFSGYQHDDRNNQNRGGVWDTMTGHGDHGRQGSQAYRNGYNQGLQYGRHDVQGRHQYQPTDSQMYQDGTNGYNSRYGNKDDYKRDFRQGYKDGYERGYRGR